AQDDDHTANGVFTVNGNLTIQGTVNCNDSGPGNNSACAMRFSAAGNITLAPGSALYAENRVGPGSGGDITLQAGGNVSVQGPAARPPSSRPRIRRRPSPSPATASS